MKLMPTEKYAGCFPLASWPGVSLSQPCTAKITADHPTILLRVNICARKCQCLVFPEWGRGGELTAAIGSEEAMVAAGVSLGALRRGGGRAYKRCHLQG